MGGGKRKLGITDIEKWQEFKIHLISTRNLSTDVTRQFQTVTQISAASTGIVYLAYLSKQLVLGKSRTSFPLMLHSLKVPQFLPRLPLTPRNDCEKT